jgi:hypothetical protein
MLIFWPFVNWLSLLLQSIAKSTYRLKARFQVWPKACMKIIKMFRNLTCSKFCMFMCVVLHGVNIFFSKKIMCLDVDFVLELDIWGPKYAWMLPCVWMCDFKTLTFLGENELNESLSWKNNVIFHTEKVMALEKCVR